MSAIWYDDAIPAFARLIEETLGEEALRENILLRDASGLLTFVVLQDIPKCSLDELSSRASTLYPYVDKMPVATPEALFDDSLRDESVGILEWVQHDRLFTGFVRILERRISGHDWLRQPCPPMPGVPPVIVFASLKGGVGRSTALSVSAAHLAAKGRNVLAIDLDLEAPGLGAMLLPDDRLPPFGALDYYVENGLRKLEDSFFEAMVAVSPFTTGRGIVHVIPAVGTRCDFTPQNVLGKLSRAYLEDMPPGEKPKTFLDQTREMICSLSNRRDYDVVLVDARAGLNETTAASLLGLGAHALLFGIQTPQTFKGYHYLLGFLGRYRGLVLTTPEVGDWRARLRMVHARAAADPTAWKRFHDDAYELFADTLYDEVEGGTNDSLEPFNFDRHADEAPHKAWHILDDSNFTEFDPARYPEQLNESLYTRTFEDIFVGLEDIIARRTES